MFQIRGERIMFTWTRTLVACGVLGLVVLPALAADKSTTDADQTPAAKTGKSSMAKAVKSTAVRAVKSTTVKGAKKPSDKSDGEGEAASTGTGPKKISTPENKLRKPAIKTVA